MAAYHSRSKRPSAGNARSPSPPEDFVLYLDENLCNSRDIQDSLTKLRVRFERHLAHFDKGIADETWLPLVGSKRWVLLTADKRIRYNMLEKRALNEYAVCEFVFIDAIPRTRVSKFKKLALREQFASWKWE
jgi:hypothetical protein